MACGLITTPLGYNKVGVTRKVCPSVGVVKGTSKMATEKQLVAASTGTVVLAGDSLPKQKARPKVALEEDEFTEVSTCSCE